MKRIWYVDEQYYPFILDESRGEGPPPDDERNMVLTLVLESDALAAIEALRKRAESAETRLAMLRDIDAQGREALIRDVLAIIHRNRRSAAGRGRHRDYARCGC